jgi:uncharacterized protein (UPF0332 family)
VTGENKRANIKEELDRAQTAKGAAEILAENAYFLDAISRAYYWVYHTVRALLLTKGLEPKTHEGTLRLFSLHFVKEGPLLPSHAHVLSRFMKYRQEADYNPSYVFTQADYTELKQEGESLSNEILQLLKEQGYLRGGN